VAGEIVEDRCGQLGRAYAARNDQAPFDAVAPLHRRLTGRRVAHRTVRVVVQLVDTDLAVAVEVGVAALETAHERAGERRGPALRPGQLAVLERVLRGAGRGQHDAPRSRAELVGDVYLIGRPYRGPAREGTAVAAVENQDHPAGLGLGEQVIDERGR